MVIRRRIPESLFQGTRVFDISIRRLYGQKILLLINKNRYKQWKKVKFYVRNKMQLYLGTKLFNMSPNELQVINTYKVTKSKRNRSFLIL